MFEKLPPKTKLYVMIGLFLLVAVILFLVFRAGKKKNATNISVVVGNEDTGGALASESEIDQLAASVHSDLKGLNYFNSHDTDVYNRVLSLSDTDLTRLNNTFNLKYVKESGESLNQWVESELATPLTPWAQIKDSLLARFSKLKFI